MTYCMTLKYQIFDQLKTVGSFKSYTRDTVQSKIHVACNLIFRVLWKTTMKQSSVPRMLGKLGQWYGFRNCSLIYVFDNLLRLS